MIYDIKWIIPKLRNTGSLWNIASSITFVAVGIFSKIIIGRILLPPNEGHRKSVVGPCWPLKWLNKTMVYNKHIMTRVLDCRPKNIPLITVSNHYSCFDDPGIWEYSDYSNIEDCGKNTDTLTFERPWKARNRYIRFGPCSKGVALYAGVASLDLRHLLSRRKMRWSLAAHDICFTKTWHSYFFMLGRCIPVIRGGGIYQEAMDFCMEKLASGDWLHIFPEGKVNMLKENMRLKWGVGRLIMESPVTPLVIPIYHLGMDQVLPNDPPYWLRFGNKVTINYGEPIDFSDLVAKLRASKASELETRKAITDRIQEELQRLKTVTQKLHNKL